MVSVARDSTDAGKAVLKSGSQCANINTQHSVRVTYQNAEIDYFTCKVFSFKKVPGSSDSIVSATSGIETVFTYRGAVHPEDIDSRSEQDIRSNGQHSVVAVFFVDATAEASVTLNKSVIVIDTSVGTVTNDPSVISIPPVLYLM